jgi:hypothetical protein
VSGHNPFNKVCPQTFSKNCLTENLLRKGFIENPRQRLNLGVLSPNPIGVINRRNGFDQSAQRLRSSGLIYSQEKLFNLLK